MNRNIFSLLLSLLATIASAQTPTVHWASTAVSDGSEAVAGIAVDTAGNSVVVGYSQATTIAFGGFSFTNSGLPFTFLSYVVKYDALGNVVWATRVNGTNAVIAGGVALDGSGNVFITGQFSANATFGATNVTSVGQFDMFLAKYDSNGNALWVRTAGGPGQDVGYSVATDAGGDCYMLANFTTNITISTIGGPLTFNSAGGADALLAKYDPAGNVLWLRTASGTGTENPRGLAVDAHGNVLMSGSTTSTNLIIGSVTLTNQNGSDVFVAKYDSSGNLLWARGSGNPSAFPTAYALAVDSSGNSFLTGYFGGTNLNFGITNIFAADAIDSYLVKFDSSGNALWLKGLASSNGFDFARGVAVDGSGAAYVVGSFAGPTLNLEGLTLTNSSASGKADIFAVKFASDGTLKKAAQYGGTNNEASYGIGLDAVGNGYICGTYQGPQATFGSIILNASNATANHVVVFRLDAGSSNNSPPPTLTIRPVGGSVAVSWPVAATGFQLETASNSATLNDWLAVSNGIIVLGTNNILTQPATGPLRIFRLKK